MGLKAGIDLGTTNSCIYVLLGDEWVVIRDRHNRPTVPSAVWKDKGDLKVGNTARAYIGQSPGPILEVKRHMGTETTVALDGERKSAVEVSALILRFLKDAAEAFVMDRYPDRAAPITDVVITHPAYFGAAARTATAEAGKQAGFHTVTLLPEPIAAALAYARRAGAAAEAEGDRKILAYDLGGGTFDVTVLERRAADGVIEVLDYGGDPWLGGANFDLCLAEHLRKQLVLEHGYALNDLDPKKPEDAVRIQQLKSEAETIKIGLTNRDPVQLAKPDFMRDKNAEPVELNTTISRQEFNDLTKDLMDSTMRLTHRTLAKQSFADRRRLTDEELNQLSDEELRARSKANAQFCDVIMVGSSCWMPVVEERLRTELGRECQLVAPDVIVAEGAVIKAAAGEPDATPIPTQDRRITVFLSCPPVSDRARRFPILGELKGDAVGCTVILCDVETDREESRRLGTRLNFVFQRNLRVDENNEFNLLVQNPAGECILEHTIRIRHDPNFRRMDTGRETLAIPLLVQTRTGFETLFAVNAALPVKGDLNLLTPNDSGMLRIPFYEGDTYLDEIKIDNAPQQKGVPFVVKAEMDKQYKVTAEAVLEGDNAKPPSVQFAIPRRRVRTLDEIQEDLDKLQGQFDDRLVSVKDEDKRLRFLGRRRQLEREIDRELQSLAPELGHVEDLAAQFRKLIEEVGMLPQLTPSYDELRAGLEPRRRYAPNQGEIDILNQLLRDAEQVWEAQDEDEWNVLVKQCRELTRGWEPPPPSRRDDDVSTQPPPPPQVKQRDLAYLEQARAEVASWSDEVAQARDALLVEIDATRSRLRSAPEAAVYALHDAEVVPLYNRMQAGPPPSPKKDYELTDKATR